MLSFRRGWSITVYAVLERTLETAGIDRFVEPLPKSFRTEVLASRALKAGAKRLTLTPRRWGHFLR